MVIAGGQCACICTFTGGTAHRLRQMISSESRKEKLYVPFINSSPSDKSPKLLQA